MLPLHFLIMEIITFEIYPIIIRTIGGWFNIGLSGIGAIIIIIVIVIENIYFNKLILYFLIFDFFYGYKLRTNKKNRYFAFRLPIFNKTKRRRGWRS